MDETVWMPPTWKEMNSRETQRMKNKRIKKNIRKKEPSLYSDFHFMKRERGLKRRRYGTV